MSKTAINFILTLLFIFLFSSYCNAQGKEANIWYFGLEAGIDFNSGSPPTALTNSQMWLGYYLRGSASIADSTGNLLFYSDGETIWNKEHQHMQNGELMGRESIQGALIVPMLGNNHTYYYFNYGIGNFRYSIIDMELDNGLGAVVEAYKSIELVSSPVARQLNGVKHSNGNDYWVVIHGFDNDLFYSFLVTADSVHTTPVISQAGAISHYQGYLKFSSDAERLGMVNDQNPVYIEVLNFDNSTGIVNDSSVIHIDPNMHTSAVAFSPDNTKLYIGGQYILQYDLEAGDPEQVIASAVQITLVSTSSDAAMQLGPDGKIYCSLEYSHYLSVINEPNELGLACNFEMNGVFLEDREATVGLPTFIASFFKDPEFETNNNCIGDATIFEITETNGIDSVFWKFNDFPNMPNDTSILFSPSYTFSNAGTFFVDLTIYSGLLEKTVTQEVIVHPLPQPQLGYDTLVCDTNFSITLNANCEAFFYLWNGVPGGQEISVSDTGTYWVRATSEEGCVNSDTINISLYPQPQLEETNLVISDAGCGQSNGSITGLQVTGTPPLSYFWINVSGNTIGYNLDVLNLSVGSYSLVVTFGNDCSTTIANYLIQDNGNLQIDSVNFTNEHCNNSQASITVYADSPTPDILTYSIDGVNFLSNGGIFTSLGQGSYEVMIVDTNNCVGNYINNPLVIQNISGVEIITKVVTPENDFSVDGSIFLEATIASGDINYSVYSGINPQTNNGLFESLSAGTYNCKIWDDFGCDTIFDVIVPRNTTVILEAISGFGNSCVGNTAVSPLKLTHFNDVYSFQTKITYDTSVVSCDGYINLNPELEAGFQASIIYSLGEVHLSWQGTSPLSLPDNTLMTDLVFKGLIDGISPMYWEAGPGESIFFDENMDTINAEFYVGEIQIYSLPEIQMQANEDVCTGDTIEVTPTITQNNGDVSYQWSGPNGYTSQSSKLWLNPVNTDQAGKYTLLVIDTMYCQKTDTIEIKIAPSPEIAFSEYDTLWVEPDYILEAGFGAEYYQWNTGETTESIIIDTMGNYNVELISYKGCKSTDTVQILWGGTPFYIPNAFTPNGDGLNDTFGPIPRYDYVNRYHMSIFNRWGQMIYENADINKGWDGTYQGSQCMMGAYVYRIVYKEFGSNPMESNVVEGTVMLVR